MTSDFDPVRFTMLGRLTALVLSPDGDRLVAVRQEPDVKGAAYVSALWGIDPSGVRPPVRLTHSEQGESQPAFRADGSLLFVSSRPASGGEAEEAALWQLPLWGEASVVARLPGGVSAPAAARESDLILIRGSRLADDRSDAERVPDDAEADRAARTDRQDRKLNHVLHDGFPIRYWDHELDDVLPRLFALDPGGPDGGPRDLLPDVRHELTEGAFSVSADGSRVALTWRTRRPAGQPGLELAALQLTTGELHRLTPDDGFDYSLPQLSPDGARLAALRESRGNFDTALTCRLVVFDLGEHAPPSVIDTGDLYPTELAWSGDSSTLVVAGDLHGRGAVLALECRPGTALRWTSRTVTRDAVYDSLCVDGGGETIYALRSTIERPPHPVRLSRDGTLTELPAPDPAPALPGRLTEVDALAPDGRRVRAWLAVPHSASARRPGPVQLWVHGGPFGSWNSWSWRWCPWPAVARGYAVLMPDPALSTGYGRDWLVRAWPHRAAEVWADLEAVLDAALELPELDPDRTALLGASFGGYLTNWIAGHTDRFAAIVTHAGLWALDQQHTTTDAAWWKSGLFGRPDEHPEWYAANSPHHFADAISTPMLVVHGNRDYRVPISEALRLWWDLVSRHTGEPGELPHRFLQFTGEHHWVSSPGNARTWYESVLGFVDEQLRDR